MPALTGWHFIFFLGQNYFFYWFGELVRFEQEQRFEQVRQFRFFQ